MRAASPESIAAPGALHAGTEVVDHIGHHQRRRRVEDHHVTHRPGTAFEHLGGRLCVLLGVAHRDVVEGDAWEPHVLGPDLERSDLPVAHLDHGRRVGGGELVEPVGAVDDPGAGDASTDEHRRDQIEQSRVGHPEHLTTHPAGV